MKLGRTILALLIALSVAMLPVAAGACFDVKTGDMSAVSTMDDMDCCPHKSNPCDKAGDCASMAACALKCFSFAGASFSNIEFPSNFAKLPNWSVSNPLASLASSPPFRPPRI